MLVREYNKTRKKEYRIPIPDESIQKDFFGNVQIIQEAEKSAKSRSLEQNQKSLISKRNDAYMAAL